MLFAAAAVLLLLAQAPVHAQEIWFGPRTPDYGSGVPVRDWDLLFHPNPEWNQLAGQIQVFLGAIGFYLITPDDQLQNIAANAASHHIALAMELGALAQRPDEPCDRQEGYSSTAFVQRFAQKLVRLGVRLQIVRLDGPLWFGHYQACKLPIPEIAARVAETLRPVLEAFPDLEIGDVEGVQPLSQFPDWQANYVEFKRDVERAMSRRLVFMHVDIDWREPDWPTAIAAAARLAHANGEKFGVIYNSDDLATTDEAWVAEAKNHFDELETRYGLIPEQTVFHTWSEHPTHVFPETSPGAHSYLVAQYRLPRTRINVVRTAVGVRGRLTQVSGPPVPVPGARIEIDVLGDDPSKPPPIRSVTGIVPPGARFADLGLRMNAECWCSGANDVVFGPLTYRETAGGSAHYEYRYAAPPRPPAGVTETPMQVANLPLEHLRVPSTANFGFNSPAFAVTPGARFEFQVPLASLNGEGLFGTAAVIWLDDKRHGFKRAIIHVGNDVTPIAATVTDASGSFGEALPDNTHWRQRPLLLHYAGSPALRAAYAAPP